MRGSLWRKWDLHLHPPGTKKSDSYQLHTGDVWTEYCRILEESDVWSFGITDYFSADGYFNTRAQFRARHPHSAKRLFANIELCLSTVVNKDNHYVNVHILFNPATPDDQIRSFLSRLKTNRTLNDRPIYASELSTTSDFNEATTTHDHIRDAITGTFGSSGRLDHVIVVPAVNNDGIRPDAGVAKRIAVSHELDKFSDAFFGNSKNVDYYQDTARYGESETARPKAVLTGSDAHSFSDLTDFLGKNVFRNGRIHKQATWIKAELTYEGLKQIVFEPAGRVHIGDEPPVLTRLREKPRRYIRQITIDRSEQYNGRFGTWFQGTRIELNPELVAIIGNKGSGKSAITDTIGLLGNSHKQFTKGERPEELFSFLNREKFLKQNCAAQFRAELQWEGGGDPDSRLLCAKTDDRPEAVEYLPQKYLERICADIEEDEFRAKLNEVIFGYVRPSESYGAENLDQLIGYLTAQANEEIRQASVGLREANQRVVELERRLTVSYRKDIEDRRDRAEQELAIHIALRPPPVPKPPDQDPDAAAISQVIAELGSRISELLNEKDALESEQAHLTKDVSDIQQATQALERKVSEVRGLKERYQELFRGAGIEFDEVLSIHFEVSLLDRAIQNGRTRLQEIAPPLRTLNDLEVQKLLIEEDVLQQMRHASIPWQLQEMENQRQELTEQLGKPNRDYQNYLLEDEQWQLRRLALEGAPESPAENTLNWLRQELSRITQSYPSELAALRGLRESSSKGIYRAKKEVLKFLDDVKHSIDDEIRLHGKDLPGYNISIESGFKLNRTFVDDFLRFINQARRGSFHGSEDGRLALKQVIDAVGDWELESDLYGALDRILERLDIDARSGDGGEENRIAIFDQLKQGKDPTDFYDFLFGLSYLEAVYELKVDGKTLAELSPGERGGVLLVFYLMLDTRDIPLVIDQPEDNLDNKSVYEILVKFLKGAKARRQIIIATHNPNLAVVADAEQIVRVSIDKRETGDTHNKFSFVAGGIEDLAINRAVVDVLEGTAPAFDNRRLKYRRK